MSPVTSILRAPGTEPTQEEIAAWLSRCEAAFHGRKGSASRSPEDDQAVLACALLRLQENPALLRLDEYDLGPLLRRWIEEAKAAAARERLEREVMRDWRDPRPNWLWLDC